MIDVGANKVKKLLLILLLFISCKPKDKNYVDGKWYPDCKTFSFIIGTTENSNFKLMNDACSGSIDYYYKTNSIVAVRISTTVEWNPNTSNFYEVYDQNWIYKDGKIFDNYVFQIFLMTTICNGLREEKTK